MHHHAADHPLSAALAGILAVALALAAGAAVAADLIGERQPERELPGRWQRGINLTAFQPDAYGSREARRAMLTARAVGVERIALVPTWYMTDASSSEVFADPRKTPTDESLRRAAAVAHDLGVEVVIKPHVDVLDGTFRGEISPADRASWFRSYGEMIDRYASLAATSDAEALIIGTELTSMSLDSGAWGRLIDRVRKTYDGALSFAANWVSGAESVQFWNRLDFIGIDAYMPLPTATSTPSVDDLVEAWGPYEVRMEDLSDRWHRQVVFTEAGYRSRVGAASSGGDNGAVSEPAQATAYEAAFEALAGERWFDGIWWWEWSAEGLTGGPGGFTPEGKPAAEVLAEWQGPPASSAARHGAASG